MAITPASTWPTAVKSMPIPGITSWATIRLATVFWPAARAPSAACWVVSPAGSCRPITPAKTRSVAWPRIFGPTTLRITLTTPSTTVTATPNFSGASRANSRFADGPKFDAFSVGCPMPAHGGPPLPPRATRICRAVSFLDVRPSSAGFFSVSTLTLCLLAPSVRPLRGTLSRSCRHTQLRLNDFDVSGAALQELLMRADADDGAVLEHDDLVGLEDGRHPLRDDE